MAGLTSRYRNTVRTLRDYGRPHRGVLVWGMLGTIAVVALRLAFPWPLKWVMELAIDAAAGPAHGLVSIPVLGIVGLPAVLGLFIAIGALLGLAEMAQRVYLKRYAAATVRDIRDRASRSVSMTGRRGGEVIARMVGDAARVKAELSGILVHVSQNFLLFVGVCLVFVGIAPPMAFFFLASGLFAIVVGYRSTRRVESLSLKQRAKEAEYAVVLADAVQRGALESGADSLNRQSTRQDVMVTRTIAGASALVHTGVAVFTAVALALSVPGVAAGWLDPGDLFLFIAYALTVHRRLVQVGRQLARSGKLTANLNRLAELAGPDEAGVVATPPLHKAIELHEVRVGGGRGWTGRRRLSRTSLTIPHGSRVLVVGGTGSGKSTLLRVLAGRDAHKGVVSWDGIPVSGRAVRESARVKWVPQAPVFGRSRLGALLGLEENAGSGDRAAVFQASGIPHLIARAPKGLATKVSSTSLTLAEAYGIALSRLLIEQTGDVWLIDEPFAGLSSKRSSTRLETVLAAAAGRTLIIASVRPVLPDAFDLVVAMKTGRVRFSGTADEYRNWRIRDRAVSPSQP